MKRLLFHTDWLNVLAESVWILEFRSSQHFQYGCNVFLKCCEEEEMDGETTINCSSRSLLVKLVVGLKR